jgi:predicted outer membrane lipoprotein
MALGVYPLRGAKEAVMSDPGGWLWLILGLVGVGGLAVAIAYGNALWLQRRKDWATKREQNETVRDNYRRGG